MQKLLKLENREKRLKLNFRHVISAHGHRNMSNNAVFLLYMDMTLHRRNMNYIWAVIVDLWAPENGSAENFRFCSHYLTGKFVLWRITHTNETFPV